MTHVDMTAMGDSVKMLRETFCVAQQAIGEGQRDRWEEHVNRLGRLVAICDEHRPLGEDGRHGTARCTPTCGCDPTSAPITWDGSDEALEAIRAALGDAYNVATVGMGDVLWVWGRHFEVEVFVVIGARIRIEGDSFAILPPEVTS